VNQKRIAALLATVLTGSIILAGCSGQAKTQPPAQTRTASTLEIPKAFPSDQAKMDFAMNAIDNRHYAEAKPLLEEALANNPDAHGYMKLGTARYNLDDYAGAMEAWNKAGELDPTLTSTVLTYTGNALRDGRKPDEAAASYRKALQTDPKQWMAAINLATLLRTQGKTADAVAVLEEAAKVNQEIEPIFNLLDSYKKQAAANADNKG
jgi:tetratricopeptide (TPR) repeat protein